MLLYLLQMSVKLCGRVDEGYIGFGWFGSQDPKALRLPVHLTTHFFYKMYFCSSSISLCSRLTCQKGWRNQTNDIDILC